MNLRLPCFLLAFLLTCHLQAIEIFLKNGDRLQGELLIESDEHFTILHPVLGEIEIAKGDLAEMPLIPNEPDAVVEAEKPEEKPSAKGAKKPGLEAEQPTSVPDEEDEKLTVSEIPRIILNSPRSFVGLLKEMNASLGFAFSDKSSRRDETDLRFFYKSKWENGKSEYRFDTDYRYGKINSIESDNRYTAQFRFRRQQQRDFFIQASTFYRRDPLREINSWLEQGIGGGWKNVVSSDFEYSMGVEGSVKYENLSAASDEIGGYTFLTTFFEDSVYSISKQYQLVQEAEFFVNPDNAENWGYRFDVSIDGKITKGISVRLSYEYNFDNLVPKNVPQKETLFSSSLLYTF
jgi:hypothetical protein